LKASTAIKEQQFMERTGQLPINVGDKRLYKNLEKRIRYSYLEKIVDRVFNYLPKKAAKLTL
jgi:hypothetical protein|tara:strand:+ start:638 stop:823 length:186 start_codon:yes stop_codon:yes gene_type:complete